MEMNAISGVPLAVCTAINAIMSILKKIKVLIKNHGTSRSLT